MMSNWNNIKTYLIQRDPYMRSLIEKYGKPTVLDSPKSNTDLFDSLVRSIISQQLSVAVANTISSRVKKTLDIHEFSPLGFLDSSVDSLRSCGLSRSKSRYIMSLALMVTKNPDLLENLRDKDEDLVIKTLLEIKGIGIWTAQMFQIFALKHLDVFAPSDAGLIKGIRITYLDHKYPNVSDLEKISLRWKPYRSIGCWYMWQVADSKVTLKK